MLAVTYFYLSVYLLRFHAGANDNVIVTLMYFQKFRLHVTIQKRSVLFASLTPKRIYDRAEY